MFILLLSMVTVIFAVWVIIRWSKVKKYWKEKGVPHYSPNPIVGSLTFLQRENPSLWMRKLYNDFKGAPYVGIWLFWRPALVVNSPEIARRVLVKDADVFRNRFLSSGKTDPIGALNVFTVNDPLWSSVRRRLTVVFTAAKLRSLQPMTMTKTKNLIKRIGDDSKIGPVKDLREICTDYTTDVIGEAAFGITSNSLVSPDSIMRRVTREMMAFNVHRGLSWCSIFFIPELVDVFRLSFFPKDTMKLLRKIFQTMVAQRGGYENPIKEPRDLLEALVKIKQESTDDEMTEDVLLAQAAAFLLGGFDTSASTMTLVLYQLAFNPHHQERLYQEVLQAQNKSEDEYLNTASHPELTFLDAVIKETLRIFPPMGWLDRIASTDYKIDDNLTIPAGTPVYVNGVAMQVDPEYFPEPEVFKPERFLPENERNIIPYTYMPFGDGPRNCIGMRFAYQSLRQSLAHIILNFEIHALPGSTKPNNVHMEQKGLFFMPDEKLSVQFVPRATQTVL
ncbi:cytochrome P450 6k1-like [Trichoplusia ni]|uniref:unspecific monooxygenase n=1 Tax=Trichoplusia ni TaxID=7111 RepID=A0A7E5VH97_TRINI|nr:cytochrome P450 6k1-like [Trichoplusia ni]